VKLAAQRVAGFSLASIIAILALRVEMTVRRLTPKRAMLCINTSSGATL
jgi:hypothetical protein